MVRFLIVGFSRRCEGLFKYFQNLCKQYGIIGSYECWFLLVSPCNYFFFTWAVAEDIVLKLGSRSFSLSADSVATVALGVISNNQGNSCNCKGSQLQNELTAFWAPFLLLHLGGQDTITAYALQDNELWSRNLLGLVVQLVMALYIFLLSWKVNWLSFLTILMLLARFIKYAERIWVMRLANCGPSTERTQISCWTNHRRRSTWAV